MKTFKEFMVGINEGLRIENDKAILKYLNDNEELISVNHRNWSDNDISSTIDSGKRILYKYIVHFGLIGNTDIDVKNRKNTMDLVKSKPEMISMDSLVEFLRQSVKKLNVLKGYSPDYLALVPSRSGLNERLVSAFKQIYPLSIVIPIKHIEYPSYASQINSDAYIRSLREPKLVTKQMLDAYAKKPNEEDGIHIIRKSNTTSSKVIQRLNPKYLIDPTKSRDKIVPIADAIKDVILNNKRMLIVDDNLHLGIDFSNIFKDIENILFNLTYVYNKSDKTIETIKHRIEGYVFYRLTNDETNPTDKKLSEMSLLAVLKDIYQELKKEYNGREVTPEIVSYISDVDISDVRSKWINILADDKLKNNGVQQKEYYNDSEIIDMINHINPGTNVTHTRFGKGEVVEIDGDGVNKWATVFFPDYGKEFFNRTDYAHLHLDFVIRNGKLKVD